MSRRIAVVGAGISVTLDAPNGKITAARCSLGAVAPTVLLVQAMADAAYFAAACGRTVKVDEAQSVEAAFLKAYRWQYIYSGAQHPHFGAFLSGMITPEQAKRIQSALATLA